MSTAEIAIIRLEDAILCADCESICNRQPDGKCAHCGSTSTLNMTTILNRREGE